MWLLLLADFGLWYPNLRFVVYQGYCCLSGVYILSHILLHFDDALAVFKFIICYLRQLHTPEITCVNLELVPLLLVPYLLDIHILHTWQCIMCKFFF